MKTTITYSIRNPSGLRLIVALTLNGWILSRGILRLGERSSAIYIIFAIGMLLFCVTTWIMTVYRALKKPTELHLDRGRVSLNGRTLQAEELRVIMKMGYVWPVIGIKPYGKRIVPVPFCFRFAKDGKQGLEDLEKWAEDNGVKMVHKAFTRWL